jgi:Secretion system C-terminal sorting domain
MKSTATSFWRTLLGAACLLPLAAHAQDASRQAAAPSSAAKPCYSCPPPAGVCDINFTATQSNGPAVALSEGGQVCCFNTVVVYASPQFASPSYTWQVYAGSTLVASTINTTGTLTHQPGLPGYSGPSVYYTVRCTAPCTDGGTVTREFHFLSIPRDYSCGQAIRPVAIVPGLELYPSPASEQLNIEAAGVSQAIVLNGAGHEVKRADLTEGKAHLSVADLPRGLYLLRVTSAGGKVVDKRFSVEH